MSGATLINHLLDNIQGIDSTLSGIIEMLVKELGRSNVPEYKRTLSSGICACLQYNTHQTLLTLEQLNLTEAWINLLFEQIQTVTEDEIKRFVVGLSSLMQRDVSELPQSITNALPNLMKALVILCEKSINVRTKKLLREKDDMADEDQDVEKAIYEDDDEFAVLSDEDEDDEDDEDYDCNDDLENLYDSKFDSFDEVIYFRDVFTNLQQQNGQMYNYHLSCLNQQELESFQNSINKALEYQQIINSQQV
jgi:importin-7